VVFDWIGGNLTANVIVEIPVMGTIIF